MRTNGKAKPEQNPVKYELYSHNTLSAVSRSYQIMESFVKNEIKLSCCWPLSHMLSVLVFYVLSLPYVALSFLQSAIQKHVFSTAEAPDPGL